MKQKKPTDTPKPETRAPDPASWLSVRDLCARWRLSDPTIRRILHSELPYCHIKGSRRYRIGDVEAYERACISRSADARKR